MDDSPLSTTANIAGILTFIAAVGAFVYVRYATLRNGIIEKDNILDSVLATIKEALTIDVAISQARLAKESDQDPVTLWMGEHISKIYSIELSIFTHCIRAGNYNEIFSSLGGLNDIVTAHTRHTEDIAAAQAKHTTILRTYLLEKVLLEIHTFMNPNGSVSLLGIMRFLIYFGETPALMRWYKSRKEVLKMVKEAEILRSRLPFHQISLIATSQKNLVHSLTEDKSKLQAQLNNLQKVAENTNEIISEMAKENAEIKRLLLDLKNPPDKTSVAEEEDQTNTQTSATVEEENSANQTSAAEEKEQPINETPSTGGEQELPTPTPAAEETR